MLPVLIAGAAVLLLMGGSGKKKSKSSTPSSPNGSGGNGTDPGETEPEPGGPGVVGGFAIKAKPPSVGAGNNGGSAGKKLGKPYGYCKKPSGAPNGTFAAYDETGENCFVFWKPETEEVINQYIDAEIAKLSSDELEGLCDTNHSVPDPLSASGFRQIPNAKREQFVKRIVLLAYPQINPGVLPPPAQNEPGYEDASYFELMVWNLVYYVFNKHYCGWTPET